MNKLFDDITAALASVASRDDIASAVAGLAFGAASASMFFAIFTGAM